MRLILLGPPGCGKGTQAKLLSRRNNLAHIGTGDIIRQAIAERTPAGLRAEPFVLAGKLAPDDLVNDMVAERFRRPDRPARFVMDGYPRTKDQAAAFDKVLREAGLDVTAVVQLDVADEVIVRRLSGRWSCPKRGCMATYHTESNPPAVPGICDEDGTPLVQRDDDKEETVRNRLVVYHKNTEELIPYYQSRGLLRTVAGDGEIEQVYTKVMKILNQQAGPSC